MHPTQGASKKEEEEEEEKTGKEREGEGRRDRAADQDGVLPVHHGPSAVALDAALVRALSVLCGDAFQNIGTRHNLLNVEEEEVVVVSFGRLQQRQRELWNEEARSQRMVGFINEGLAWEWQNTGIAPSALLLALMPMAERFHS